MSFIKKGLAISAGQIVGILLNMIGGIFFARLLGPAGMGKFELFRSSQSVIVTLFALGMGNASIYFLNNLKVGPKPLVSTIFRTTLILSLLLFIILVFTIFMSKAYFGDVSIPIVIVFSAGACASLITLSLKPVLTADLASTKMILVDQAPRLIMCLAGLIAFFNGLKSASVAITSFAIGGMISLLLILFFLRKFISFRSPFEWPLFKSLLKYGLKLSASDLLVILTSNVPVMLLRYFQPENFKEVGLFTRAIAISSMISLVPYSIGPLLYAKWSKSDPKFLSSQAEYAMRVSLFFSAALSAAVFLLSKYIVLAMYGAQYLEAVNVVRILALSLTFYSISNICINMLSGHGKAGITMNILLITFLIVLIVTTMSVKQFGMQGAAVAVVLGNIFNAVLSLYYCKNIFNLQLHQCFVLKKTDVSQIMSSLF